MNYNICNSHQRDSKLHFDETEHKYTVNGEVYKSVTTLVNEHFEQFDADYWAARKAPGLGMSPSEVKAMWEKKSKEACILGTQLHEKIERYYLGLTNTPDETYHLFQTFTGRYKLTPYRTEWAIYDEDSKIAGTLDFLNFSDGKFTIFDWKRSNNLIQCGRLVKSSRWSKTALAPISHIPDTTYWHYALQVSIYRYILEKNYGIMVSESKLAVFHPDNRIPYVINIPYLRDEAIAIMNHSNH